MSIFSKILYQYKNGNYFVTIYPDGTKIRKTMDDDFIPIFPESIDIKITNYCENNCPMCHESSNINGAHANLNHPFLTTLHKGTELAIGGGNPLSHPQLNTFLHLMKIKGVICNMTVNEIDFIKNKERIKKLIDDKLIYGLGISLLNEKYVEEICDFAKENPNTVIHLIAGIVDKKIMSKLYDKDLKILLLGYKTFGRGKSFFNNQITDNINYLKDNLNDISTHFKIVSFDNLAIDQLVVQNNLTEEEFEKYYMGDDGSFTMYIDLVKEEFGASSISNTRYRLKDNIIDMFKIVRETK